MPDRATVTVCAFRLRVTCISPRSDRRRRERRRIHRCRRPVVQRQACSVAPVPSPAAGPPAHGHPDDPDQKDDERGEGRERGQLVDWAPGVIAL